MACRGKDKPNAPRSENFLCQTIMQTDGLVGDGQWQKQTHALDREQKFRLHEGLFLHVQGFYSLLDHTKIPGSSCHFTAIQTERHYKRKGAWPLCGVALQPFFYCLVIGLVF